MQTCQLWQLMEAYALKRRAQYFTEFEPEKFVTLKLNRKLFVDEMKKYA